MSSHRWPFIIVALVTVIVFGRVCSYDFSWWDDWQTIHHNPILQQPAPVALKYYWSHSFYGLYVPITYTVWIGLAAVSRLDQADTSGITLNPWIYHSANVLLHIVSSILVYVLLRMLVKREGPACLGAILFAVHPVQVESVAWVSGMKDVLAGCLSLAALCRYVGRAEKQTRASKTVIQSVLAKDLEAKKASAMHDLCAPEIPRQYARNDDSAWSFVPDALGTLFFIAAMLAKPSATMVPLIAICFDRWIIGRHWRDVIRSSLAWIVLTIPVSIIARIAQDVALAERAPLWVRPFVVGDTYAFYLFKLFFPISLGLEYGRRPPIVMHEWWFYGTWIIPAIAAIVVWQSGKRWLMAAGAIFVVAILPVSGLFIFEFQGYSTTADHYLYLAMLGPAMALAFAIREWDRRAVRAVAIGVLALFGFRAFVQTGVWHDDFALFRNAVAVNPTGFLSHHNLGCAYYTAGDYDNALIEFRKAVELNPNYTIAAGMAKNAEEKIAQRDAQQNLTPATQSTQPSAR